MSHRCECLSRVFVQKPVVVTCAYGGVIKPRDFELVSCVRCNRSYILPMAVGKKKLIPCPTGGVELEKTLLGLAIEWGWFDGKDGKLNSIITDEEDRSDVKRLGLEVKEPVEK